MDHMSIFTPQRIKLLKLYHTVLVHYPDEKIMIRSRFTWA